MNIFLKPLVPFSTGVTLTKRPSNSYERPVAEFSSRILFMWHATENGFEYPELPQSLLHTTKNGYAFPELTWALLDTSNKHGIIDIISAGVMGPYLGHAI